MRANIHEVRGAQGEKLSIRAQSELDVGDEVAALILAEHRFRARRGEFYWAAELLRHPQNKTELDIGPILRAETAARVQGDKPQLACGNPENGGEVALLAHHARPARAKMQRMLAGGGIEFGEP